MQNDLNNRPSKQRKKRDNTTVDYFDENKFRTNILPNIHLDNYIIPDSFVNDIYLIADGMINTEFRNNTFVLEYRDELKNECFYEVLKSLRNFNCDKGRAFAYFNRIIKNTLLKIYYKNHRLKTKEIDFFSISVLNDNSYSLDEALENIPEIYNKKVCNLTDELNVNKYESNIFSINFNTDYSKINKLVKKNQNIDNIDSAVHKYLSNIIFHIDEILNDDIKFLNFFNYLKYDLQFKHVISEKDCKRIFINCKDLFIGCLEKLNCKNIESTEINNNNNSVLVTTKVIIYF